MYHIRKYTYIHLFFFFFFPFDLAQSQLIPLLGKAKEDAGRQRNFCHKIKKMLCSWRGLQFAYSFYPFQELDSKSFLKYFPLQCDVFDDIDLSDLCYFECGIKNVNHSFQVSHN